MQEIIDERSVEIEKVYQGLTIVHEMFSDLSKIVEQQSVSACACNLCLYFALYYLELVVGC